MEFHEKQFWMKYRGVYVLVLLATLQCSSNHDHDEGIKQKPAAARLQLTYGAQKLLFRWNKVPHAKHYGMVAIGQYSGQENISPPMDAATTSLSLRHGTATLFYLLSCNGPGNCSKSNRVSVREARRSLGYVIAAKPTPYMGFGTSVSSSKATLAVGSQNTLPKTKNLGLPDAQSAVYFFQRERDGAWKPSGSVYIDNHVQDRFAQVIHLNHDATRLLVAAPGASNGKSRAGMVYVFEKSQASWKMRARLQASDGVEGDQFGAAMDIAYRDGKMDYIAIAAPGKDINKQQDAGAVYLFKAGHDRIKQVAVIHARKPEQEAAFGYALAYSGNGRRLAVSLKTPGDGFRGAVDIFHAGKAGLVKTARLRQKSPDLKLLGEALAFNHEGDLLYVGAPGYGGKATGRHRKKQKGGAVVLFQKDGRQWKTAHLFRPKHSRNGDRFGARVASNALGTMMIATSPRQAKSSGAAFVFRKNTRNQWIQSQKLTAFQPMEDDMFGTSVFLKDSMLIVGALAHVAPIGPTGSDKGAYAAGAVYVFESGPDDQWHMGRVPAGR